MTGPAPRSVAAVWLALLLTACGAADPQPVTLAELAVEQEARDGDAVTAEGVLRTHDDPRHYWIEDADSNRVELRPHDGLASLVGRRVRVTGTFAFDDAVGRTITVDELVRAD